jgi:hypothetical protein
MDSDSIKCWTGGAQLGAYTWFSWGASWPFATLVVSERTIILTLLGTKYVFDSSQVTGIEQFDLIPFLATGLKIKHNIPSYPKSVIFWILSANSKSLLDEMKTFGYASCA